MPINKKTSKLALMTQIKNYLFGSFLLRGDDTVDAVAEAHRYKSLTRMIMIEGIVIVILAVILVLVTLMPRTIYFYSGMTPDHKTISLPSLEAPNMTDDAIQSWAVVAVQEIMNFGFGNYAKHLVQQRSRFTGDGWDSFKRAFATAKTGETFKQRQLVLSTVPTNMPVITQQGLNEDGLYQWIVEMPLMMTYTTNNNVTRRDKSIIRLTIVRVSATENLAGVGIQTWQTVK